RQALSLVSCGLPLLAPAPSQFKDAQCLRSLSLFLAYQRTINALNRGHFMVGTAIHSRLSSARDFPAFKDEASKFSPLHWCAPWACRSIEYARELHRFAAPQIGSVVFEHNQTVSSAPFLRIPR